MSSSLSVQMNCVKKFGCKQGMSNLPSLLKFTRYVFRIQYDKVYSPITPKLVATQPVISGATVKRQRERFLRGVQNS